MNTSEKQQPATQTIKQPNNQPTKQTTNQANKGEKNETTNEIALKLKKIEKVTIADPDTDPNQIPTSFQIC